MPNSNVCAKKTANSRWNATFKKSHGILCERKQLRFKFIYEHRAVWPIKTQCRVLKVSRAAYYKSLIQPSPKTIDQQRKIISEIRRIHSIPEFANHGSPRMYQELSSLGVKCSENSVAKLMRKAGIRARTAAKFKVTTTDSKHDLPIAPYHLNQHFTAQKPNHVWLTDFTYIPIKGGFTYLCTVQDLYSRRIVGWATSPKIDSVLALNALNQAIALRQPRSGLIVHSDRGSQFASQAYRELSRVKMFIQSMSRKGNCYDNAPIESFFKSFKSEDVYQNCYQNHEEASRAAAN